MAQDAYPVPGRRVSLREFRAYSRTAAPDQATGLAVIGDSSGRHVKVQPGAATVDGIHYVSTATETLPIGPNTSGNPRIDAVVLRLDPAATPIVRLAVKPGTPTASPVPPALTTSPEGVYEITLATVRVGAGAVTIAAADISRVSLGRRVETTSVVHNIAVPTGTFRFPTGMAPAPYRRALVLHNGDPTANPARLELRQQVLEPGETAAQVTHMGALNGPCRFNWVAIPV